MHHASGMFLSWIFNLFLKFQYHCPETRLFPIHIISFYLFSLIWLRYSMLQIQKLIANGDGQATQRLSPFQRLLASKVRLLLVGRISLFFLHYVKGKAFFNITDFALDGYCRR